MTVTTAVTPVSLPMALAIVDEARAMEYGSGVIGLRGRPDRAVTADHQHEGRTVRVRPAESALAARELLAEYQDGEWLVIVTDRGHDDLGAGLLSHLIWQRLRNPDPWDAVRRRFAATGIDPALTGHPHGRDLAAALVAATPPGGWPAAPAGVLTRAHALGAVARSHLGFDGAAWDVLGVLRWSMRAHSVAALAELRRDVGDTLADATLDWIAERTGTASRAIRPLLARGELADVVPIGVVLNLLIALAPADGTPDETMVSAIQARARLDTRWGTPAPALPVLAGYAQATQSLLAELVHDRRADAEVTRALDRADTLLTQLNAGGLARYSPLLAGGLRARFVLLADALRRAVGQSTMGHGAGTRGDTASPTAAAVAEVEAAWGAVLDHRLAERSPVRAPFQAAVRLVRWLAHQGSAPSGAGGPLVSLGALARDYAHDGAWADAAINDASGGVDDAQLSPALQAVASAARTRRRQQERAFARALAEATALQPTGDGLPGGHGTGPADTVWYLERLLPGAVLPLARRAPVLLLVLDGMSVANATEILADATTRLGWLEAALPGADARHRAAGLAVLPSLTEVSRASLLCGSLVRGQQTFEQSGYDRLTRQVGKISASLFHKKAVDSTAAGWSVSHEVGQALDDKSLRLVTIVLNTIDDTLDRNDPAGIVWTADAVKHLEPLLARAAAAGRTVVITADHGHVIERRQGTQRSYLDVSSGRSRAADGSVADDEVEVTGPRVLTDDHRAVLAVDETLRYGPLKAGYHGGASAAEVVVSVAVLVPRVVDPATGGDEAINPARLALIPPQEPAWWPTSSPLGSTEPGRVELNRAEAPWTGPDTARQGDRGKRASMVAPQDGPTLFELEPPTALPVPAEPDVVPSLGDAVVRSRVFKGQRKLSGRLTVTDEQVARFVDLLAATDAHRLPPTQAAQALGVAQARLRGAVTQVQQLLNVEGYAVLAVDAATGVVILNLADLGEQFEVGT